MSTIAEKRALLTKYTTLLEQHRDDLSLVAYMLRDLPEIAEAGLRDLHGSARVRSMAATTTT